MECNVTKQAVVANEVAFDGIAEQSLECDIILPDYCPDIVKILKCELHGCVTSSQASGDRLELTGLGTASVLYMSDDNPSGAMEIRSIDYKIPYVKNCELKGQTVNPIIDISIKTDYVNCRAVSKRRIEVRGAVSHKIRVVTCQEQQIVDNVEGMGIQLKRNILDMTTCLTQSHAKLVVREELELGQGKPSVASIITSRCFAVLTDYKVISGKIVTKGELRISVLYYSTEADSPPAGGHAGISTSSAGGLHAGIGTSSAGGHAAGIGTSSAGGHASGASRIETMEYSLPISQIVDATGADDTCLCSIKYQLCTCEVQPKANLEGEMRIFTVDAEIGAEATVHRKTQAVLSADCYCTGYDCSFQSAPVTLMTLIDTVREAHMFKGSVDMPNNIKGILNGWSSVTDQSVRFEKGILSVDFKLNLCLIAVDSEGAIQFYDKTEEVTHTISLKQSCEQVFFLPNLTPVSMAYTMAGTTEPGGQLDVRTEVMISGCIYCMLRQSAICEVVVDEQKPKPRDKNCALTIYYADKGESLWDIAKSYNTAIDLVMEENTLQPSTDPDLLSERTMLLIPMI